MSCGVLSQLTSAQLLTTFSNNSGPTPNIYVSIHGGELPAGNVDSYNAKVAAITSGAVGADWRTELTKLFVAVVPSDLIVVKFSVPFCNNASDAEMEADLRYWWSSPLWAATTEGVGIGAPAANILLNTCTIYGPGQSLYNQWLVFDDPEYFNIFSLPHFEGGRLAPTAAGSGDPMLAAGGLGENGRTLKDWARADATQKDRTDYPDNLHYRHFDMQELLNYLSPATRGSSVAHHIATGPHMNPNFVRDVPSAGADPVRVVYFFSCAPRPDPRNWAPLLQKFPPNVHQDIMQNVFGGRKVMYDDGRMCFQEIRAKLLSLPRNFQRPELKSWRKWCIHAGLNCAVAGMGGSAAGGGGGDPVKDALAHFNLYWQHLDEDGQEGQDEIYVQSTQPSQPGGPDSQVEPGAATQQQWSGGRRRKRRRKRRRTRQKHRRRRRRRRTRRKRRRRRRAMVGGASAAENDAAIDNLSKQLDKNLATISAMQDEINQRWGSMTGGGRARRSRKRKKRRAMVGGSKKSYSYDNAQKLSNMALKIEQNQILINNMQFEIDRAWTDPRYSISPHFLRAPATS